MFESCVIQLTVHMMSKSSILSDNWNMTTHASFPTTMAAHTCVLSPLNLITSGLHILVLAPMTLCFLQTVELVLQIVLKVNTGVDLMAKTIGVFLGT